MMAQESLKRRLKNAPGEIAACDAKVSLMNDWDCCGIASAEERYAESGRKHAFVICVSQDGLFDTVLVNDKLDHCFGKLDAALEDSIQVC